MPLVHQRYNERFVQNAKTSSEPLTPEAKFGVRVVKADVAEGETYWRLIGVHHLLPEENVSKHNIYIEALDEQGNRLRNPIAWAGWTWEGRRPNERADPVPLDKPANETAGDIAIHFGQKASVWIKGLGRDANDKSDRVENLHTAHPDEPLPDGRLLNTLGHHSFYVVFQRTRKTSVAVPDGVITGRVEGGQGRRVRLVQNNQAVAEQSLDANLTFRFANLPAGVYRLEIVGANLAQDNLTLSPSNKTVNLNLTLATPPPPTVAPPPPPPVTPPPAVVQPPSPVTPPPVVTQPTTPPATTKTISYYLLLGPAGSRGRQTNLLLAANYILTFSPTVGFSVAEAKQSRQVTIIGEGISAADQQAIQSAGAQVEVLTGDPYTIEAKLNERIHSGRSFGG
jgi:hypothetical protein